MRISNYSVDNRLINFVETANITGNENVDTFHFGFDSEWDVFNYKYLVLMIGTKSYIDRLDANNEVVLRPIAYDKDNVYFGVYGASVPLDEYDETPSNTPILSTNIVWLETIPSIFGQIRDVDGLPDKTVWQTYTEEMLALLARGQITLEECQQALNDTQSARDTAQGYMEATEGYKNTTKDYMDTTENYRDTTKGYMDDAEGYKNDTNQLKQDTQGIVDTFNANVGQKTTDFNNNATSKTNAFNQNATDKTNAFDGNATSKTNTFNGNVTDKTNAFNQNASDKTSSFNQNATNKTNAFDSNATSKTGDFNTNATNKTNSFNSNATDKTTAFNENYTEKSGAITQAGTDAVNAVEGAEATAIAHIQEEGASYDERLDNLELLASNFDEATTQPSDDITIEDALNARAQVRVMGKSKQDTYTGKNKFNNSTSIWNPSYKPTYDNDTDIFTFHRSSGTDYIIPYGGLNLKNNTQYTIYIDVISNTMTNAFSLVSTSSRLTGNLSIPAGSTGVKEAVLTTGDTVTSYDLWLYCSSTGTLTAKIMLVEGTTAGEYEKYNGEHKSPSPDYPQEIVNVSGNVVEETSNKNLFDITSFASFLSGYFSTSLVNGELTITKTNTSQSTFQISLAPNTIYSMSFDLISSQAANNYYIKFVYDDDTISDIKSETGYSNWTSVANTSKENKTVVGIRLTLFSSNTQIKLKNIHLEAGTTVTPYVEHKGKTVTLTLPEGMELKSIPETNYRDYFYKSENDGRWHYYQAVKKGIIDAANAITEYSGYYWVAFSKPADSIMSGNFNTYRLLCECASFSSVFNVPYSYQTSIAETRIGVIVKSTDTIEDIRPKINGKSYYYPLKEPVDTEITDATLKAQLEELEKLETYKGVTHIYATSEGLAPDNEVTYLVNPLASIEARLELLEE